MKEIITSKDNANVKYAKKIMISSKFRKQENAFSIEGVRLCEDAVKSGVKIKIALYTQKCYDKFPEILNTIILASAKSLAVNGEIINIISDTDAPQGIVCICEKFVGKIETDFTKIILLENIQNPSNLGSILRTADALNLKTVAISSTGCDVYNPKVLRGAMGAVFRLNIIEFDSSELFIKDLQKNDFKIYATVPNENAVCVNNSDFSGKVGVVLGNEGNGIDAKTIKICNGAITIPMSKSAESLNVSVASGIIMWEIAKRGNNIE